MQPWYRGRGRHRAPDSAWLLLLSLMATSPLRAQQATDTTRAADTLRPGNAASRDSTVRSDSTRNDSTRRDTTARDSSARRDTAARAAAPAKADTAARRTDPPKRTPPPPNKTILPPPMAFRGAAGLP